MKLVENIYLEEATATPREKQPFTTDADRTGALPVAAGSGRKILVVDDNEVVLKACELKLKASGFKVVTARDPLACLAVARSQALDAIVLDLNFPLGEVFSSLNWDGLRILRWLKHCDKVARVPVIILTSDESEKHKELALAEGAAAHFQKPADWNVFASTLAGVINQKP